MPNSDNDSDHLRARAEIEALKARYARRADAVFNQPGPASAVALADLFTADGILDLGPFGRYEGRAALLQAFTDTLPQATRWSTHYIVSPLIDVTHGGKEATASWYFLIKSVAQGAPPGPPIEIYGGYDDTYRRVDGTWLIRESLSSFFVPPT